MIAAPELVAALEAAWPGVSVKRFRVSDPSETLEPLSVALEFMASGNKRDMIAAGLVTHDEIAALPPCGKGDRSGLTITVRKHVVAVESWFYVDDSDGGGSGSGRAGPGHARVWDVITSAMAPAVWRPPETTTT